MLSDLQKKMLLQHMNAQYLVMQYARGLGKLSQCQLSAIEDIEGYRHLISKRFGPDYSTEYYEQVKQEAQAQIQSSNLDYIRNKLRDKAFS